MVENLFWLTGDKGVRIIHGIFITAVVASYLGPANYGLVAYATSLLAIATPLITLGFDSVIVREFITDSERGRLFWTVAAARLTIGVASYLSFAVLILLGVVPTNSSTEAMVLLVGCAPIVTLALDVPRLLFQAEIREKWVVWITNFVLLLTAGIKLVLVVTNAFVESFAIVNACTVVATMLLTSVAARFLHLLPHFRSPDRKVFLDLLKESWPLILSGLSIALYMNVDIVMLRYLKDAEVVGIYSVAARLSAFWFFIPLALAKTLFPGLARAYARDKQKYESALFRYLHLNTVFAYLTVVAAQLLVPPLIYILFDDQYFRSIPCFRLHAIAILFVFLGVARAQHLNLEKAHIYGMWATLVGVATNIGLNLTMIPIWDEFGAASATVISFGISAFVTSFVFKPTRRFAQLQCRTLMKPWSTGI